MKRTLFYIGMMVSFLVGGYVWKMMSRFQTKADLAGEKTVDAPPKPIPVSGTLVQVADRAITAEDLEFEYAIHTSTVSDSTEMTQIPELGAKFASTMEPLRQMLLASLIERRMLFHYIGQETDFDINNSGRYVDCLKEWQDAIAAESEVKLDQLSQERLKSRVCENSIIKQYLNERAFKSVAVDDAEIKQYYEKNSEKFKKPARIILRHILLADEDAAKKVRTQVNRGNFAALAKQYSVSPESAKGGVLGPFSRGELPSVFDVAFEMGEGEIKGVLKSPYGFHIFLLEKKLRKQELSRQQAESEIKASILADKREKALQTLVDTALNTVEIKQPQSF